MTMMNEMTTSLDRPTKTTTKTRLAQQNLITPNETPNYNNKNNINTGLIGLTIFNFFVVVSLFLISHSISNSSRLDRNRNENTIYNKKKKERKEITIITTTQTHTIRSFHKYINRQIVQFCVCVSLKLFFLRIVSISSFIHYFEIKKVTLKKLANYIPNKQIITKK